MFIWLCEKNELGNLEGSNLICDLAIAGLKDSETPKYPKKKKNSFGSHQLSFRKKIKEISRQVVLDVQQKWDNEF